MWSCLLLLAILCTFRNVLNKIAAIKVELPATIIVKTLGPIEWLAVKLLWDLENNIL